MSTLRMAVRAATALAALSSPALAATGTLAPPAALRVSVTLTPPVPITPRQLRAMVQEADAVWRPYDVALVWLTPSQLALVPPADARLRVTFVHDDRRPDPGRTIEASALGSLRFLQGDVPDEIISLSAELLTAMVLATPWNGRPAGASPRAVVEDLSGRALGRVLAHEIGHYLLALRTHTRAGLMRRSFNIRELAGWGRDGFRLDQDGLFRLRLRTAQSGATSSPAAFGRRSSRPGT